MNKKWGLVVIAVALLMALKLCNTDNEVVTLFSTEPQPEPRMRFGLCWDSLNVDSGDIKSGQTLSHLLDPFGITPGKVATLAANSRDVYKVTSMRQGQPWWVASSADSTSTPLWFIYEKNNTDYVVFSLGDTLGASLGSYPVDTVYRRVQGVIENSLYLDLKRLGESHLLALSMSKVYDWTIDFSHVRKGDTFDAYYFQQKVNLSLIHI